MKHIQTFESFLNETKINEASDIDGFIEALKKEAKQKNCYVYVDDSDTDTFVIAVSKGEIEDADVKKMFDSGRPATGATMFSIPVDDVNTDEIEKQIKKSGLPINIKNLTQAYLAENTLYESKGQALASKYDASPMSDLEDWDDETDDASVKWKNDVISSGKLGTDNDDFIYQLNSEFTRSSGEDWNKIVDEFKKSGVKFEVHDGEDESYLLFSIK